MQFRFSNVLIAIKKIWPRYIIVLAAILIYLPGYANFDGGNGTAGDPYLISTLTQLNSIRNFSNSAHYKLTANINAAPTATWNGGQGWLPLPFYNGTFDGNDFTITGLTINRPSNANTGLFSQLGGSSVIKNLTLSSVSIVGGGNTGAIAGTANAGSEFEYITISGSISGVGDVGGLLGTNQGDVQNCIVNASVSGTGNNVGGLIGLNNNGNISNSNSSGSVSGSNAVGGLVGLAGYAGSSITESHSSANVNGNNQIGGLVGNGNNISLTKVFATGSVSGNSEIGGLIGFYGFGSSTITNAYATGIVSGSIDVGGFVGVNQGTINLSHATGNVTATGNRSGGFAGTSSGPLTNVYARGNVSGNNFQGGLVGRNESGSNITNAYSTGSIEQGGGNRGGLVGFNQATVNNSFWDTQTSGTENSAGGTGRTTAQMKTQTTFTNAGWDFTTIWGIDTSINDGYPHLQIQQIPPGNTWTGALNSQWHNAANWNTNQVPGSGADVTIPITPNDPVISTTDVEIAGLFIESGAILTIGATGNLTVNGSLLNQAGAGGLVIASNSAGTGSLIQTGNNVSATFQRYVPGLPEAWHLLSSPVQNQAFTPEFTPDGTYGDGTGYDLFAWHEPDTQWTYFLNTTQAPTWQTANGSNNFVTARGYLVAYQDTNPNFQFQGTLHRGNINIPVTKTTGDGDEFGFNLVGNPYPSSIDWKASSGWNRTNLDNQDGGYDIWMWNDAAYNYGVYNSASASDNGTLNVGRYIAPTQGFFVKASTTGNLGFSNDIRVHQGAGNWLKPLGPLESLEITVQNSDAAGYDQVRVEFGHTGAYKGSAKKFSFVAHAPSLYVPLGKKEYSIRMLSDKISYPVLPLSFKAGANGIYTIHIEFDKDLFDYLVLEDLKLGQEHDLRENSEYSFQSEINDDANRFVLKFRPGTFANPHDNLPARLYGYNGNVYADLSLMEHGARFELFDLSGRKVFSSTLQAGQNYVFPMQTSGLYIGRLSNQNGFLVEKLFF